MVRTPHFHCRGPRFNPWSGELRSCKLIGSAKKKKKNCDDNTKITNLPREFKLQFENYKVYTNKLSKKEACSQDLPRRIVTRLH